MEGIQNWFGKISEDLKAASEKASSSFSTSSSSASFKAPGSNEGLSAALSDQSRIIVAKPVRGVVSLWTCSKFCTIAFCCWDHCWLYAILVLYRLFFCCSCAVKKIFKDAYKRSSSNAKTYKE